MFLARLAREFVGSLSQSATGIGERGFGAADCLTLADEARKRWPGEVLMARQGRHAALAITLGTLAMSTVWFGATSEGGLAVAELLLYAASLLLLLSRPDIFSRGDRMVLDLPVAALMLLPLVQLLPLPSMLTRILSPGLTSLRESLGLGRPMFLPLSAYPYATWHALARLSAAGLVFFILTRTATTPRTFRLVLQSLVWLGIGEATYGLIGYLLGSPTILAGHPQYYPGSATGTLVCKNHFAGLMEMLTSVSVAYYLGFARAGMKTHLFEERARRIMLLVPPVIMGLALVFSHSRAGITCFGFSVAVALIIARRGSRRAQSRVVVAFLTAAFLVYGNAIGFDPVIERFEALSTDYAMSRFQIWRDGLRLAALSPLLGAGAGTWASLFPVVKSTPVQLTFSHAHNDYVEALAEGGVAGLLLILWLLLAAGTEVKRALSDKAAARRGALVIALSVGVLSLALHGLVDFNLQIPSNLFLFMAVLALLSLAVRRPGLIELKRQDVSGSGKGVKSAR